MIKIRTRDVQELRTEYCVRTSRFMLRPQRKTDGGLCIQGATMDFGATISSGGGFFGWCRGSGIADVGLRHAPGTFASPDGNIALICASTNEIACLYVAAADAKKAKEKSARETNRPLDIIISLRKKRRMFLSVSSRLFFTNIKMSLSLASILIIKSSQN